MCPWKPEKGTVSPEAGVKVVESPRVGTGTELGSPEDLGQS